MSDLSPSGDFITIRGNRLHYVRMGKGPKAVVIHGASGNLRDWTLGPARRLAETNELLIFDRPGLGFSERNLSEGYSPFVQAALMRDAAAALGFGEAILIGHSYGGSVSLAWALDAPDTVRALLLLAAPSQVWEGGVDTLYSFIAAPVAGPVLVRLLPLFAGQERINSAVETIFAPQDPPPRYAEKIAASLSLRPETLRANGQDIKNLLGYVQGMVPRYGDLTMPVELLHGTTDTIVPKAIHSDKLVTQLPNARLTALEGIGHMPHHSSTDEMAAALIRLNRQI